MTPEEFILKHVDIRTAGTAHMLDSSFMRNLMNEYANHRVELDRLEWGEKRIALQKRIDELMGKDNGFKEYKNRLQKVDLSGGIAFNHD